MFGRLWNLLKLYFSYLCSVVGVRSVVFSHFPSFLSVEPVNYCNLKCPQCPVGNGSVVADKKRFDVSLFEKIVDSQKNTLCTLIFYFQGEPLLCQKLCHMIAYAKRYHIYTIVSTNAQVLSPNLATQLVDSGLDKLIVSIDGLSQQSYAAYRVGGTLKKALDGIASVATYKNKMHTSIPHIEMQCLRLKSNEEEWGVFRKQYRKLGADSLVFKTAQFYNYESGNELMPTDTRYARYRLTDSGVWQLKSKLPNRCYRLWAGGVIDVNGDFRPCCFDKKPEHVFGNLYQESLASVWNSDRAIAFRKAALANRKAIPICQNCTSN